ncbi:MAG TPA: hypothetical protein VGM08_03220 [Candidatus Saccharimonadales bacterium]|jgi:hypothetical protein
MSVADTLNPPIQYDKIWFIIGLCIFVTIPIWYGALFWLTRRKPFKSFNRLRQLPTGTELDRLKAKYLRLIEEWYQRYRRQEIDSRVLHWALSMNVRYFVYEAKHFPAPVLTLADLKLAPYPALTNLIEDYYPEEFAELLRGDAETSVTAAKGLIQQWN